jgi:hypothetical protein
MNTNETPNTGADNFDEEFLAAIDTQRERSAKSDTLSFFEMRRDIHGAAPEGTEPKPPDEVIALARNETAAEIKRIYQWPAVKVLRTIDDYLAENQGRNTWDGRHVVRLMSWEVMELLKINLAAQDDAVEGMSVPGFGTSSRELRRARYYTKQALYLRAHLTPDQVAQVEREDAPQLAQHRKNMEELNKLAEDDPQDPGPTLEELRNNRDLNNHIREAAEHCFWFEREMFLVWCEVNMQGATTAEVNEHAIQSTLHVITTRTHWSADETRKYLEEYIDNVVAENKQRHAAEREYAQPIEEED